MIEKLNMNNGVPLYKQLIDAIRQAIANGELKVDCKIPTEEELSKKYEISRITVRNAIEELVEDGLLIKRQGKGTYVAPNKVKRYVSDFMSFTSACEVVGRVPSAKVLSAERRKGTQAQTSFLGLPEGSDVIALERIRFADGIPVMVETIIFPPAYEFILSENLESSVYQILSRHEIYPTKGRKTIGICYANHVEKDQLEVDFKSALLLINDQVFDQFDKPLHCGKQVVNSDRYLLVLENYISRSKIN